MTNKKNNRTGELFSVKYSKMLSFSQVAEALTGLIYHRPSGENFSSKQSLSEFKSCEHTHFDHLLRSATLLHFMTMEYITSNKGGRKLVFENNISIKQKVLSNGTVWGDFVQGDFVRGDFLLGRILSRGILSGGVCQVGFCPRTLLKCLFVN